MGIVGLDKVLVDTSAWIEFFRKREPHFGAVATLIDEDRICCVGLVLAELIQCAKSEKELKVFSDFPSVFAFLPEDARLWAEAGRLSRMLRGKGRTIGLSDCFIAAAAISADVSVYTLDAHFESIRKAGAVRLYGK